MEEWQVKHITRNISELIINTKCSTLLLAKLEGKGVLSKNDRDILQKYENNYGEYRQSLELFDILKTRVDSYDYLLEPLIQTNQTRAVKILSDGVNRFRKITREFKRHVEIPNKKPPRRNYNAIIRGLNGELLSKVYLQDMRNVPKYWTLRYMNVYLPSDTDLETILCDDRFPLYINVNNGSTFVDIFVKTLTGKTLTLKVLDNVSVAYLKFLIFQETGIHTDQMRLIYAGKQLENDEITLGEYKIPNESTLRLSLRLRGGLELVNLETKQKSGVGLPAIKPWEGYGEGINPVGECLNEACPTQKFNKGETIDRVGYYQIRLSRNTKNVFCAACAKAFTPDNFLLSCGRSLFRFKAQSCQEIKSVVLESLEGHEQYKIFDPVENSMEYDNIEIVTVSKECSLNFCIFCEVAIKNNDQHIYECQHASHKMCANNKGCGICEAKFISIEEFVTLSLQQQRQVKHKNVPMVCMDISKRVRTRADELIVGESLYLAVLRGKSLKFYFLVGLLAVLVSLSFSM